MLTGDSEIPREKKSQNRLAAKHVDQVLVSNIKLQARVTFNRSRCIVTTKRYRLAAGARRYVGVHRARPALMD